MCKNENAKVVYSGGLRRWRELEGKKRRKKRGTSERRKQSRSGCEEGSGSSSNCHITAVMGELETLLIGVAMTTAGTNHMRVYVCVLILDHDCICACGCTLV